MSVEHKVKIYSIKRSNIDEIFVAIERLEDAPEHYTQVEDFKDEANIGGMPNTGYFELLSWRMYCLLSRGEL